MANESNITKEDVDWLKFAKSYLEEKPILDDEKKVELIASLDKTIAIAEDLLKKEDAKSDKPNNNPKKPYTYAYISKDGKSYSGFIMAEDDDSAIESIKVDVSVSEGDLLWIADQSNGNLIYKKFEELS